MIINSDNDTFNEVFNETINNGTVKLSETTDSVGDLIFNLAIITFQLVTFIFILVPKSVKVSLKIFLMSLTLPGFLQNCSWAALRVANIWFRGPLLANEVGCTLLLIVTHLGSLNSQTAIAGITVNNYVAVTHPVLFKRWVTPCKTGIAIAGIWCFWIIVTVLATTITKVDSKKPCLPMVVSSYFIMLVIGLVILITAITVAYLNLKLAIQFWGKFKIYPVNPGDVRTDAEKHMSYLNPNNNFSEMPSSSSVFSVDDLIKSRASSVITVSVKKRGSMSDTQEYSRKEALPTLSLQLPDNTSSVIIPGDNSKLSGKQVHFEADVAETSSAKPRRKNQMRSHQRKRQLRDRNLALTLIMLTIWNSIGYLPYMVMLLLSVKQREGTLSANSKSLSEVNGIIVRVAVIGNTFIYAWRFINWRSVCSALNNRFAFGH